MQMDELVHRLEPSPNFNDRDLPVSMVVIHYTEMTDKEVALERLCDPESGVSAHYLIGKDGEVVQLVDEDKRAWHAGVAYWRGHKDVNSASIGIELDHPGHKYGYTEFPRVQIDALVPLLARIMKTHDIPRANIVGHSDVAPMRKIDPGEFFPWERLAEYGLALPTPDAKLGDPFPNDGAFYLALERYGYDITNGHAAVRSFQRRWRPHKIDGEIDGEIRAILFQLLLDRDRGNAR